MRRLRAAASMALLVLAGLAAFAVAMTTGTAEWVWAGACVALLLASRLVDPPRRRL